jgi:hypothetical protein
MSKVCASASRPSDTSPNLPPTIPQRFSRPCEQTLPVVAGGEGCHPPDATPDTDRTSVVCRLLCSVGAGHRLAGVDSHHRLIAALRRDGHSIRTIAARVGLSKSRVHEIVTAQNDDYDDDYDEPDTDDEDYDPADDLPPLPWTFGGYDMVRRDMGRGERPKFERGEVWTDAHAQPVNFGLEAYRLRTYAEVRGEEPTAD